MECSSVVPSSVLSLLLLLLTVGTDTSWAAAWSYDGKTGPHYWYELFPQECSGMHQSPINIRAEQTLYDPRLKDFALWKDPPQPGTTMTVLNNGHTVQVVTNGDLFVTNAGLPNIYKTVQFHFHWGDAQHRGSEHLIDDAAFPLELHVVNYNWEVYDDVETAVMKKQGLAVLGVMFELSDEDNEDLEPIIAAMEQVENPEDGRLVEIEAVSLRNLLPDDLRDYFRYNGSLTTPGCFETVIWTVFAKPQTISFRQMEKFRDQMQMPHKKHRGHHKKRSVGDPMPASHWARRRERRALQVLNELALNPVQQARFRRDLAAMKDHSDSVAAKMDEENAGHSHRQTLDAVHQDPHPQDDPHTEDVSEVEVELLQDRLVNNYRPVQPLNDRIVYRSFKLRPEQPSRHHHTHNRHHHPATVNPNLPDVETIRERLKSYGPTESAAGRHIVSLLLLAVSACLAAVLM
ncbi:hypothetical protein ACOMHN_011932 [Nucella lapillus]